MALKIMNGLDLTNQKIVNLADPSANTDAANKQYVDNVARGLYWKQPVRVASTTNITIASPGTTIDGATMATNDRVLLKDQSTASQNGIYTFNGSSSPMTRTSDADNGTELAPGTAVTVMEGTANADKAFIIISDAAITIGTTNTTWGQLGGGTSYTASNGVLLTGSNFTGVVVASGGLTVGASGFAIDTAIVPKKFSANVGNGSLTSIPITHNIGTKDIVVAVREVATDSGVLTDWTATDINTVTLVFATAPASNSYRVTVAG